MGLLHKLAGGLIVSAAPGESGIWQIGTGPIVRSVALATGGDEIRDIPGTGDRYHLFRTVGSHTFKLNEARTVQYLIIGGGGSGGGQRGGGGGAGGFLEGTMALSAGSYAITVGAGGTVSTGPTDDEGNTGDNSTALGLTAYGGGGGGGDRSNNPQGKHGGSGGGAADYGGASPGNGVAGQGFGGGHTVNLGIPNYPAAGGGGAGNRGMPGNSSAVGHQGGDGGVGKQSSITGVALWYAGGGGGGTYVSSGNGGMGGIGGGGHAGSAFGTSTGQAGQDGTGGGGGGGCNGGGYNYKGGAGGSGIVVIRYTI